MSEMTFDASQDWRQQQASATQQFMSQLAQENPHTVELGVPASMLEDGGA